MKWRQLASSASLPRAMRGVRMVNLNNHIYLIGGYEYSGGDVYHDDILQYKDGDWIKVGKLNTKRGSHAVSVANYKNVCK